MTTVLRYPYEAITETTDYLQIAIKKYVAGGLPTLTSPSSRRRIGKATDVGATASSVAELVDDGIILLPMPSNIQDSNSVGYFFMHCLAYTCIFYTFRDSLDLS